MGFLVSLICVQLAFIGYLFEKKIYNFMTIFNGIWACVTFLATLRLFGMYDFSDRPYIIILIGNIAFALGYLGFGFIYKNKKEKKNKRIVFNYKIIWILLIICGVFYSWLSFKVFNLMNNGMSYNMIRSMYQGYASTSLLDKGWEVAINYWIGVPFMYVLVPILIVSVVEKTSSRKFLIISLITIAAYIYGTAGRVIIVYFAIESLFILMVYNIKIDRKVRRFIWKIIIVGIIAMIVLTGMRQSKHSLETGWNTVKSIYAYICIDVPLLDYWTNKADQTYYYTYGLATLKGILELAFVFINKLSFSTPNFINNLFDYIASFEEFIYIFPNQKFNAFISIFYTFYLDFRYIGVSLGMFAYGGLSNRIFNKIKIKNNVRNILIMLIFVQGLLKSIIRFEFISVPYILAFIFVYIVTKNESIKIKY